MTIEKQEKDSLLSILKEREKELNCLYQLEEFLNDTSKTLDEILEGVVSIIPSGWQHPDICQVRIKVNGNSSNTSNYLETEWKQSVPVFLQRKIVGSITVSYFKQPPHLGKETFLKEEYKLLGTIADRLSQIIYHSKYQHVLQEIEAGKVDLTGQQKVEWQIILELLKKTDRNLYIQISRKMLSSLCTMGIKEADDLIQVFGVGQNSSAFMCFDDNRPISKQPNVDVINLGGAIFKVASKHLSDNEIFQNIQKWIQAAKSSELVSILGTLNSSLQDIVNALMHYKSIVSEAIELYPSTENSLRVSLLNRFFFDQLDLIKIAKNYITVNDYYDLVQKIVAPVSSHGKLGGKSAGLFLASKIIKQSEEGKGILKDIKVPKTWHVTSDAVNSFLAYNNLEDIMDQKYKGLEQIRIEYPQIIKLFKNSSFPPELIKGLSMALDDFGNIPLVVRSSSLLEDRFGTAFSGKYKSLFLANQGTKQERLTALMDAIAEVYASIFAPDPIEYRIEHGLLDFHEEMGIMIQEVVGTRVNKYYFPHFAGVAFCFNEFRWSPRIKREDGLIRIVPGLGTRAVDRLSDDYPVLLSPGQPNLRANVTIDEMIRYSPQKMDVINLETNTFETIKISDFLKEYGEEFEGVHKLISIIKDKHVASVSPFNTDFADDDLIFTFEGIASNSPLLYQVKTLLKLLQDKLGTPVDIEFAHNGKDFYLLQCRSQAYEKSSTSAQIPPNIPLSETIFTAKKYVSNGSVPDITHIVYVDPMRYNEMESLQDLADIGRAVSKLNKILPKRQFILIGPGRWGSKGDIKLGVKVTYSDFNNTAMLVEVARKKGNYVPDLSFGTHFFLDLVEASIRYLPLYPDDPDVVFNEMFFAPVNSVLPEIMPEYAHLADVIRVIDVPKTTCGKVLRILMNADEERAVGFLVNQNAQTDQSCKTQGEYIHKDTEQLELTSSQDEAWRWRYRMAELLASNLDAERFSVKGAYLIGSTKNATAKTLSDIDIIIHFTGDEKARERLLCWLNGWSLCLDEFNFFKTGAKSNGILDIHLITDEDIENKTSFAVKINAVTDAARPLKLRDQ